jgi:hypothetical protein
MKDSSLIRLMGGNLGLIIRPFAAQNMKSTVFRDH